MRYEWIFGPANVTTIGDNQNVVTQVTWYCVGYDDASGKNFKTSGVVSAPTPDLDNLISFDQITADVVKEWVYSQVNQTEIETFLYNESLVPADVASFNF
jgi:hypothetical protein